VVLQLKRAKFEGIITYYSIFRLYEILLWLVAGDTGEACVKDGDMGMCMWRWIDPEIQKQVLLNEEDTLQVLY